MDFLRDFRHHAHGSKTTAEWKPSSEVVLGVEDLPAATTLVDPGPGYAPVEVVADHVAAPAHPVAAPADPVAAPADPVAAPADPVAAPADPVAAHVDRLAAYPPPTSAPLAGYPPPGHGWPAPTGSGSPPGGFGPPAGGYRPPPAPPFPPAPSYPFAGPRRPGTTRPKVLVVLGVVAAIAIIAASGVVVHRRLGRPNYPGAWDPRVAQIASFVARERGLSWKHPIRVDFLSGAQFEGKAEAGATSAAALAAEQQGLDALRAFGLVSGRLTAAQLGTKLVQNDLSSFSDPTRETIYVKGSSLTPLAQLSVAFELDQALLDQYFQLDRLENGPADAEGAVSALAAGDADRVQAAYAQSLPAAERETLQREARAASSAAIQENATSGIPPFVVDLVSFPDDFGLALVGSLLKQGGTQELNAAFRHPPTFDGQVVDPTTYAPGLVVHPVKVPPLPAGTRPLTQASGFGEVALVEMLGDEIGFGPAWQAVQGWTADQGETYTSGGRTCASLAVLTDSSADAGNLARAAAQWARHLPQASANRSGTVVYFRSCDPGTQWRPVYSQKDPYQALATRAFWIGSFLGQTDMDTVTATCVTDGLITEVGADRLHAAEDSPSSSPAGQAVVRAIARVAPSCGYAPPSETS